MANQEAQQVTISGAEFNNINNELRNLAHIMSVMKSRFENQPPPTAAQDLGSPPSVPSYEVHNDIHILSSRF